MFRPGCALLEDRFKNFAEKEGVEKVFVGLVKEQVGVKLPIGGNEVFADESEDETGLVVGVKGFGVLGEAGELLFEKFDGAESGTAGILVRGGESAKQGIECLKEFRIAIS